MPNYSNSKIYRVWSPSHPDEIYIGSTTQPLAKRMGEHRKNYKRYQEGKKNYITSFKILEYGDAKIELIERVDCKCREELIAREGHYIRTLECVNKRIENRTKKEYYRDNKEKTLQRVKQYREENKDKINKYRKQHYKKNKEIIRQKHKQYYQDNKEKWTRGSVKIKCECSAMVSKNNMARHKKSKKHLAFVNSGN